MAALGFLIIFLDLFNFGIYACGKKDTRNQGTYRKDGNIKAKLIYLPTGGTK
jgi:hypothetical protein